MNLSPYSKYKNAAVSWLGKIPAHWAEKRAKYFFQEIDDRSETEDEELLTVSHITGVTPRRQKNVNMFMAESNVGLKRCIPGDLVINTMWAWMAALGVSRHAGIVSPSYAVYRPITNQDFSSNFIDHLLRTEGYRAEYRCRSTGIRASRLRLYPDKFLGMFLVCPPREEQDAIVRYIKWIDSNVIKYLRAKRRVIELLMERKRRIVTEAVTRGLDPAVPLKPSGVDWIGDIPAHWEVAPLKQLVSINKRVLPESTETSYQFRYIDISSVGSGGLTSPPVTVHFGQAPSRARRILTKGDTIISTVRTYLKAVHFVSEDANDLVASTGFAVLTPKNKIYPPFLGLLVLSDNFINRVIRESVGVAYPAIAESKLGCLHVTCPSSIEEQQAITVHVDNASRVIDQAIARARREIELMREYRTRLISDVVTGQVDVRGMEIPNIAEETLSAVDEAAFGDEIVDVDMDEDQATEEEEAE